MSSPRQPLSSSANSIVRNARRIGAFLREQLAAHEDPRSPGKALTSPTPGTFWRYRVGDYRLICDIDDGAVRILVIQFGNRRDVYR